MTEYQWKAGKAGEKVVSAYRKIENGAVAGYKAVESGVVSGYKKIEKGFVDAFLSKKPVADTSDSKEEEE